MRLSTSRSCRCLSLLALSLCASSVSAQAPTAPTAAAFADKLRACETGEYAAPHPLMRGFDSVHKVEGMREDACRYTQSMPGGMSMECAFGDAGRAAMADEIAQSATRMQGSSKAAAPAWAAECEILTAEGKRMPVGGKGG